MKSVSTGFEAALTDPTATLSLCARVVRKDAEVFGFTDADIDIVFEGLLYEAATGVMATSAETATALAVDSVEFIGFISGDAFTVEDIEAGVWDGASIEVFQINRENIADGKMTIRVGEFGQVSRTDTGYRVEVRGLMDKLQKQITRAFLPACDADLGDARCGVDLGPFTETGTVTAVTTNGEFEASAITDPAGYFKYGVLTWLTGANAGLSMEVKEQTTGGNFELILPMPFTVAIGDTFDVVAGCDKTIETCIAKFTNVVNFRGFPHIPGRDRMLTPGGV